MAKGASKSDPTELKIALDNRAFEIQLFWQRSNYFLVLMTALGIGTFSVKDPVFSLVVSTFATACSFFWFRTNLGSKFWQESWEFEVTALAKKEGVQSFVKSMAEVKQQVRESLSSGQGFEVRSWLRRWIDKQTVSKPSVTYNMILLSLFSTLIWLIVTIIIFFRVVAPACTFDDLCLNEVKGFLFRWLRTG